MKEYDLIAVGTGSAMNIVEALLRMEPEARIAIIDKDEPGGICLTRACIPTKLLIYPADVVRIIENSGKFGIEARIERVNFSEVMERMSTLVREDIQRIGNALEAVESVDYYRASAEFTAPYELRVDGETIRSKRILLCLGSRPAVPEVPGLEETGYHTSDSILQIRTLPKSLTILGGGYIAAEFGHFFSAMGCSVTVVGRNPRFLPREEPEISDLARKSMSRTMEILTGQEVIEVKRGISGGKEMKIRNPETGEKRTVPSEEILVATGRAPTTDLLHPERSGVGLDEHGWVVVNEFLETTKKNIWAFGDATGRFLFKHVANYESRIVYYNALLGEKRKVDYHAVPHAVFSCPEIAGVGLKEEEAIRIHGEDAILIGFHLYEDTARGEAMDVTDGFVKVIVKGETHEILGAHIIGPEASVLIQEVVSLMYTRDRKFTPILEGMHIHPALGEVVERAFTSLMTPHEYHDHFLPELS
jgi:mycothione reductase